MNPAFIRAVFKLTQDAIRHQGFQEPNLQSVSYEATKQVFDFSRGTTEIITLTPEEYVERIVGKFLHLERLFEKAWDDRKSSWRHIDGPQVFLDLLSQNPNPWYWWPCKTDRNAEALFAAYLEADGGKQPPRFICRIDGSIAIVRYDGHDIVGLKATKGMKLLAFLAAHQGQEYELPQDLENAFAGVTVMPGGKPLKASEAKSEGLSVRSRTEVDERREDLAPLHTRLKQIEQELTKARSFGNSSDAEKLESEKEDILKEVRHLTIRLKRKSDWDPETKKVINRLRNCITRALKDIGNQKGGSPLAEHFRQSIFPFHFPLTFRPEPPIEWHL